MELNDKDGLADGESLQETPLESGSTIPYASAHWRAKFVIGAFLFGILFSSATFACHFHQYQLMNGLRWGRTVTEHEIDTVYNLEVFLNGLWSLWYFTTAVAFLMWIHRAHRNLPALGAANLEFSPRGAVGWYFAPFLNLFKPYQVMREIYNASEPSVALTGDADWRYRNAPAVVKLWWALFLIMNFVANAAARADILADTPGAFQFVAATYMVDDGITIAAILAAIWLVWSVDRRQESRAILLGLS